MLNEIIFIILAFLVCVLSATFGFGAAIVMVPISTFLLPIKDAIAILTLYFLAENISKIVIFRKHIYWKMVWYLWRGAIPGVIGGAMLMAYTPSEILEKVLGLIVLVYIINDYFKLTKHFKLSHLGISLGAIPYGFFSGIIGTGEAIKAIILTHLGITKEKFIATMATSAIGLNLVKIIIYSKYSLIDSKYTSLIIALVISALVGTYVGRHFVKKIHPDLFKKVVLIILTIISLKLLFF